MISLLLVNKFFLHYNLPYLPKHKMRCCITTEKPNKLNRYRQQVPFGTVNIHTEITVQDKKVDHNLVLIQLHKLNPVHLAPNQSIK